MRIVVFGATGGTGKHLVRRALAIGHEVTAVARNPSAITEKHERLRVVKGDTTDPASVDAAIEGAQAVLAALGSRNLKDTIRSASARNIVAAMKKHSVKRLVWMSASGVGDSREQAQKSSFVFGRVIMPLMLKNVFGDHALGEGLIADSGLDWTIVRPVGLNDKPARGKVVVTPPAEKIKNGWITREDVAQFMLDQLDTMDWLHRMPVISN